jgi:small conductance mechanosensitive channel
MEDAQRILLQIQELLTAYGLKVLAALAILFFGRIAAGWTRRAVEKLMAKGKTDPMIIGFVGSIAYVAMMVFVVLAALGQLGIQTTSFIAVLGAAGLAIGLALQGSLSNFAAGFLLIMFRPFKVGDFIEGAGVSGTVESIEIFTTTLRTGDNKTVIVPNSKLLGDNITNYSAKETRRVDLTVGVSYDADLAEVKRILNDIASKDERVKTDPPPLIAVSELADNSVNLVMRLWTNTADYWNVYFETTEAVKLRLDEAGIGIPYPQRDVHIYEHKVA